MPNTIISAHQLARAMGQVYPSPYPAKLLATLERLEAAGVRFKPLCPANYLAYNTWHLQAVYASMQVTVDVYTGFACGTMAEVCVPADNHIDFDPDNCVLISAGDNDLQGSFIDLHLK